jgi:hypothetical protein
LEELVYQISCISIGPREHAVKGILVIGTDAPAAVMSFSIFPFGIDPSFSSLVGGFLGKTCMDAFSLGSH